MGPVGPWPNTSDRTKGNFYPRLLLILVYFSIISKGLKIHFRHFSADLTIKAWSKIVSNLFVICPTLRMIAHFFQGLSFIINHSCTFFQKKIVYEDFFLFWKIDLHYFWLAKWPNMLRISMLFWPPNIYTPATPGL